MNRIKEVRLSRGLSQAQAGELADLEGPQVSRYETGSTSLFNHGALKLAKALGLHSPVEFIPERSSAVQLIGLVGAGAEVLPLDEATDWVEGPPGLASPIAVRVVGGSMIPAYKDGDLLFAEQKSQNPESVIGKDCIVQIEEGPRLVKRLHRGSKPNYFRLFSYENHDLSEDVCLLSALPVVWVRRK